MSRRYLKPEAVRKILTKKVMTEWCEVTMFHINDLKFNYFSSDKMEFDRYLRYLELDVKNEYLIIESALSKTPREKEEVYRQVIPLSGIYHIFWIETTTEKDSRP